MWNDTSYGIIIKLAPIRCGYLAESPIEPYYEVLMMTKIMMKNLTGEVSVVFHYDWVAALWRWCYVMDMHAM
eukprot:12972533-Ditylum_brightwellii.AAC.1